MDGVVTAGAGMSYNPLKAQGDKLDLINIMSYDADNQYSPITAYQSYQALLALNGQFSGKIVQGVSSQQECCGHQLSYDELNTYANWLNVRASLFPQSIILPAESHFLPNIWITLSAGWIQTMEQSLPDNNTDQ